MDHDKALPAEEEAHRHTNWKLYLSLLAGGLLLGKVMAMAKRDVILSPEMRLGGIVSAQIVLFILTFFNEKLVYAILILYMPFSLVHPGDYGFAVNIANILIFITFVGLIARSVKTGQPLFQRSSLDKLIVLWLMFLIISFMRGAYFADRDWTILVICLKRFLTPLIIYFLTFWIIINRDYFKDCLVVLLLGLALAAFMNIKDAYVPSHFVWEKRWGGGSQGNQFAAFLVYSMFIYLAIFWQNARKPLYWGLLLPFFWCVRSVMLSYSRGGWIAFAAASVTLAFLKNKFIGIVVIVLFLLIYTVPSKFLPQSMAERIEGTTKVTVSRFEKTVTYETSAQSRRVLWKGALKMIARNPILGVGYTWAPQLIHLYAPVGKGIQIHNGYLQLAAEMGIPALIVFSILIHHIFKASWDVFRYSTDPLARAVAHGYIAGIVGFIAANMFGDRFSSEETITYFWVMAAIIMKIKTSMDQKALPV